MASMNYFSNIVKSNYNITKTIATILLKILLQYNWLYCYNITENNTTT